MPGKTFTTVLVKDDKTSGCAIVVPFDPKEVFGKVRAPVKVTIHKHTYRSTIARMGGECFVVVNAKNREAAGVAGGDKVKVTLELDTEPRVVTPPKDLASALKKSPAAKAVWDKLSYTHKREYVEHIEDARKPETRARRIDSTIARLSGK